MLSAAIGSGRSREPISKQFWQTSLNNGVVADSALAPKPVKLNPALSAAAAKQAQQAESKLSCAPTPPSGMAVSPTMAGCRKLPKPLTKLTWDNAALVSPASARKLGVTNGDVVKLSGNGQSGGSAHLDYAGPGR